MSNAVPLVILGVYNPSPAYPNVRIRLDELKRCGNFAVREIHITNGELFNRLTRKSARCYLSLVWQHIMVLVRYLKEMPPADPVYIPYPAVFMLFLLSLVPQRWKPHRLVADAFISLYDTAILDRQLFRPTHIISRLLWHIERRAYAAADAVIVDTSENMDHYAELFRLPREKFIALPLSTDEEQYMPKHYNPNRSRACKVLFAGTFIPLHGVDIVIAAAQRLYDHPDIIFRIIGDGQTAPDVRQCLNEAPANVRWETSWLSTEKLAAEIADADICLGVFGTGDKAQRVCPLKIYAYACTGRPIITANTRWTRSEEALWPGRPWIKVPPGNPEALAQAIMELANNPELRIKLAAESRRYYESRLANSHATQRLVNVLKHCLLQ